MLPFWHGALERTRLKCACNLESNARAVGRAHLSWDKDGEDTMKMLLLAGVGLIALGILGSGTLSLWRKKRYGAALGVAFSLPFILFVFFLKVIGPVH